MRRLLLIGAIAAAIAASPGSTAHAGGVADELSAGASLRASTTPSLSWIADRVSGTWDVSPEWQFRATFGATRPQAPDGQESRTIFNASGSADLALGAHWTLSFGGGWSPEATTSSSAGIADRGLPGGDQGEGEAVAELTAKASSTSLEVSLEYDTAGTSDHETTASISVGETQYQSLQQITSITDLDGQMLEVKDVAFHCTVTRECSGELRAALSPNGAELTQVAIGASLNHTLEGTGTVGVSAGYYLYDDDPTRVGYFSLATIGRGNVGNGIGVSPLHYTVSPSIGDRWGALSGLLSLTYGVNFQEVGYNLSAMVRLQYKLALDGAARLKLYTKLAGSRGSDQDGNTTSAASMAFGAQYSW